MPRKSYSIISKTGNDKNRRTPTKNPKHIPNFWQWQDHNTNHSDPNNHARAKRTPNQRQTQPSQNNNTQFQTSSCIIPVSSYFLCLFGLGKVKFVIEPPSRASFTAILELKLVTWRCPPPPINLPPLLITTRSFGSLFKQVASRWRISQRLQPADRIYFIQIQ